MRTYSWYSRNSSIFWCSGLWREKAYTCSVMFSCWKTKKGKSCGSHVQFSDVFWTFSLKFWYSTTVLKSWGSTWGPHVFLLSFTTNKQNGGEEKLVKLTYQSPKRKQFSLTFRENKQTLQWKAFFAFLLIFWEWLVSDSESYTVSFTIKLVGPSYLFEVVSHEGRMEISSCFLFLLSLEL